MYTVVDDDVKYVMMSRLVNSAERHGIRMREFEILDGIQENVGKTSIIRQPIDKVEYNAMERSREYALLTQRL